MLIFPFLILGFVQLALAEDKEEPSLALEGGMSSLLVLRDNFIITYSDQVTDGCLPQPHKMKDKMEISLRQNNFSIETEEGWFPNKILVTALGFSTGGSSCAIHLSASLSFWASVVVPYAQSVPSGNNTLAPLTYDFGSVILTGSKHGMQARVEKQVKEFGDTLFLDISRAKDLVNKKFPEIFEYYKTQLKKQ